MEDAATAEIYLPARSCGNGCAKGGRAHPATDRPVTVERFDRLLSAELDRIHDEVGAARLTNGVFSGPAGAPVSSK